MVQKLFFSALALNLTLSLALSACDQEIKTTQSNPEEAIIQINPENSEEFKDLVLTNEDLEKSSSSFKIQAAQIDSNSLKGTVFGMKKLNKNQVLTLEVTNIRAGTDYNHIINCSGECEVKVTKDGKADGTRKLDNNGKFLHAGFKDPAFKKLKLEVVSKTDNNIATAGIFEDAKIKAGDYLSPSQANSIYGSVGTNTEVYDLPITLKYLGNTNVSRATINKKAFAKLALFLASWASLTDNRSYSGAFHKRYINGTTIWSNHSWGGAIDLLTHDNNGKKILSSQTAKLVTPKMKEVASRLGITWGGYWSGKSFDPMHWEVKQPKF